MKAVVQRVSRADVTVAGRAVAEIQAGLLVLLGVQEGDTEKDAALLFRRLPPLKPPMRCICILPEKQKKAAFVRTPVNSRP